MRPEILEALPTSKEGAVGAWPVRGVLLTHLHLDHLTGLPDLPRGTPVYAGPGEVDARGVLNLLTRGMTDRVLDGLGPVEVWPFRREGAGGFEGLLDVFGDGSLWAIHLPGHTPGSTAYLARTARGSVLLTGDVCHTRWG